ncbi:MAG: hypothetical protein H7836_14625 [Magnetococcus sp. YQC-3]
MKESKKLQTIEHIHRQIGEGDSAFNEVGISGLNYSFYIKTNNKKIRLDTMICRAVDILAYLEKTTFEKIKNNGDIK